MEIKKLTKILIRRGRWEKLMLLNIKHKLRSMGNYLQRSKVQKEGFGKKYKGKYLSNVQ